MQAGTGAGLQADLPTEPMAAPALMLVRPRRFAGNPQTQSTNRFQQTAAGSPPRRLMSGARREVERLARALGCAGIEVLVAADRAAYPSPDAVFPNNWFSTHSDGTVILYPMLARNRRRERRRELLDWISRARGFALNRVLDLSGLECQGEYLEGTGSLVLDRRHRRAFAALSPRTTRGALAQFRAVTGYEVTVFRTCGPGGQPVYHTNVLLAIGSGWAIFCPQLIVDPRERDLVRAQLAEGGRSLVEIAPGQVQAFAGNCLEAAGGDGPVLLLSDTGWRSLAISQRRALEREADLLPVAVPLIERHGGGSVRCMLAEVHLPRAPDIAESRT